MDEKTFFDGIAVSAEIKMAILARKGVLGQLLNTSEYIERGGKPHNARNLISAPIVSAENVRTMPAYY